MKKILSLLVIIIIIVIMSLFKFGFGFGSGNGSGDKNANTVQNKSTVKTNEEVSKTMSEDSNKGAVMKVSVVGNDYFYNNERISLDDFVSKVKETSGDISVEVKDDGASLRAYNDIINRLKDLHISITEE